MSVSPTQRSLQLLRQEGYTCQVVEKFVSFINKRIDFLGCIDILGVKKGEIGVLGIQTTSDSGGAGMSEHTKKALASKELVVWLETGNKFIIHAWGKKGKAGKVKHWQVRQRELTLKDLEGGDN